MEYLLLTLSWVIFYGFHSFLAASKLKRILKEKLGRGYKWYRLFYSLFSFLLFLGIIVQSAIIPVELILPPSPWIAYFGYMFAAIGTIIGVKSSKAYSWKKFLGLIPEAENEAVQALNTSGWYARTRHPLYFSLLLLFGGYFLVAGTISAFVHLACLILYLPVGIYFEEQNLIEVFGETYRTYQKTVPSFFPRLSKKNGA
ncbi:NnrU family protein [Algoriphagus sp. CAU 1675]|uniref:methyltransferase family protein n=1 Tax=Algoriphagus sp. CAU 1675 TaxID=3032597 RepID=UPI0023DC70B0|nr:NnrU family protein [Algoriphagus sp. CAU 1675]MDF2156552.1 NnrU family protein [Algoriphagus sp. CAU 1675]